MKLLATLETLQLVLKGLLANHKNISALNSGEFLSTRISNPIVQLRSDGLRINTEMYTTANGKRYGKYSLVRVSENISLAKKLLKKYGA